MARPKVYNFLSPSNSQKKPPKQKLKPLWMAVGLLGVAIASAAGGAMLAVSLASTPLLQSKLHPSDAKVFDQGDISTGVNFRLPALTRPVNILILGMKVLSSDVNNPPADAANLGYHALVNSFDGLSDTMLMLRFDPATYKLVVLSIPRDTRTWVDGLGTTKLNEANAYGGPALSAKSVSNLLGDVPIDRYVRINVQGVEKLVDALGGVTVFVPQDMKYTDESQHLFINLKQGEQHLNGRKALDFLRFRYDRLGDIGRVQRQQMLMRALVEQTLSPATLTRIPQILTVIQENVDTNLSVEELVALVGFAAQTERANLQMLMLPGDFSGSGDYAASYWLPNHEQIDRLVARYFFSEPVLEAGTAPDSGLSGGTEVGLNGGSASNLEGLGYSEGDRAVEIAIQDSTGNADSAQAARSLLEQQGYRNLFVDDPWDEPLRVTRIIAQRGDMESAQALQAILGVGEVRVEATGNIRADITVQLGADWAQHQTETAAPAASALDRR